jgi:DNA polymerase-4
VGGSAECGVVAAASYEARKFGVRSAMPSVTAKRQCPDQIFVRPRFEVYKAISLREIFAEHTAIIEPLSLDEAYLDVTASVSSIDAGRVHDLRIMVAHGFRKSRKKATVVLERVQPSTECPQIARL